MSNELTIKNEDLLTVVENRDLGELIKPLVNEIHLFDTVITGTSFMDDSSVYDLLEKGEKLILQRENNKNHSRGRDPVFADAYVSDDRFCCGRKGYLQYRFSGA